MDKLTLIEIIWLSTGLLTLGLAIFTGLYQIIKSKLKEDFSKMFVSKTQCTSNHKVSDVMLKALDKKVDGIGIVVTKISEYLMTGKCRVIITKPKRKRRN